MELGEIKEKIKSQIKWDIEKPTIGGGQSVSPCRSYPVILISEELEIKITVGYHKSMNRNKELAIALFDLALDELID
jgi:hypothetical protein